MPTEPLVRQPVERLGDAELLIDEVLDKVSRYGRLRNGLHLVGEAPQEVVTTSGPNSLSGVDAEIFSQPVADGGSSREEGRQLSGPRAVTTHLGEQLQSRQSPRGGRIVTFPLRDQPVNDTVGVEAAADDRRREGVHTVGNLARHMETTGLRTRATNAISLIDNSIPTSSRKGSRTRSIRLPGY